MNNIDEEIKVSIYCTAFNHEQFLRKCLDGFVNQKTNFKYEAIIHDDASTDGTIDIIKEYQEKYPEIIKPIFEKENQHSKDVNIFYEIFLPIAKGKYIAFCEGDDYWCDSEKLQKQYDFMEKNRDCSMCVHNTVKHDLLGKSKDVNFNNWNEIYQLNEKDVFLGWDVHTSSYFIRRNYDIRPEYSLKCRYGDYVFLTIAFYNGKVICLPDVMSVYNINNPNGLVCKIIKKGEAVKSLEEYLVKYNDYTNYKYDKMVSIRLIDIKFNNVFSICKEKLSKEEFYSIKNEIKNMKYYNDFINNLSKFKKIKYKVKLSSYFIYRLHKIYFNIKYSFLNGK